MRIIKQGGTLKVNVGARAMGNIDPAPGVVKQLKVMFSSLVLRFALSSALFASLLIDFH